MTRILLLIIVGIVVATSCYPDVPIPTYDPSGPCDVILHPAMLSVPFDELDKGQ